METSGGEDRESHADEASPGSPDARSRAWLADYSSRLAQTMEESLRAGTARADRWARRSLEDQEWSTDAMTAEVIADWEELTPLLGRWLDLWLEAAQQPFAGRGPVSAPDSVDTAAPPPQPRPEPPPQPRPAPRPEPRSDRESLLSRRAAEYQELWEGAAAKFRVSAYRSEDLLDDWLTFSGKAARDLTAGAALFWGTVAGGLPRPGPDTGAPRPGPGTGAPRPSGGTTPSPPPDG